MQQICPDASTFKITQIGSKAGGGLRASRHPPRRRLTPRTQLEWRQSPHIWTIPPLSPRKSPPVSHPLHSDCRRPPPNAHPFRRPPSWWIDQAALGFLSNLLLLMLPWYGCARVCPLHPTQRTREGEQSNFSSSSFSDLWAYGLYGADLWNRTCKLLLMLACYCMDSHLGKNISVQVLGGWCCHGAIYHNRPRICSSTFPTTNQAASIGDRWQLCVHTTDSMVRKKYYRQYLSSFKDGLWMLLL